MRARWWQQGVDGSTPGFNPRHTAESDSRKGSASADTFVDTQGVGLESCVRWPLLWLRHLLIDSQEALPAVPAKTAGASRGRADGVKHREQRATRYVFLASSRAVVPLAHDECVESHCNGFSGRRGVSPELITKAAIGHPLRFRRDQRHRSSACSDHTSRPPRVLDEASPTRRRRGSHFQPSATKTQQNRSFVVGWNAHSLPPRKTAGWSRTGYETACSSLQVCAARPQGSRRLI